ncbi:MAG: hypothetical protein PVI90_18710 [Desulfobacteraceae bacterium]|jgi:hypothetical protein
MWFKKHLLTIVISCTLLLTLIFTMVPITHKWLFENRVFNSIDLASTQYINDALLRAGAAYALSRSFNAVISVFEESHLQLEPAGVGVSLALGEVLDPINDLVERFSWIMLASITALGIQKALVIIGPWFSLSILLPLSLILILFGYLPFAPWRQRCKYLGKVIMVSVIFVRFAVPVMAFLNHQVYVSVLEETHNEAIGKFSKEISQLKDEIPDVDESHTSQPKPSSESLWDKTKEALNRTLDQSKEMITIQHKIKKLKTIATEMFDRLIDLIVVFVLNTIVLPLLFLWAIVKLGKKIGSWDEMA